MRDLLTPVSLAVVFAAIFFLLFGKPVVKFIVQKGGWA
jgi:hypothetical protein